MNDTTFEYVEGKGRGEIVVKVTSENDVHMVKRDGRERLIMNMQKLATAAVIKTIQEMNHG